MWTEGVDYEHKLRKSDLSRLQLLSQCKQISGFLFDGERILQTLGIFMLLLVFLGMLIPAITSLYWPNWRLEDQQRREDWNIVERLKKEGREPESEEEVKRRSQKRQAKLRKYWVAERKNDPKNWKPISEMDAWLGEVMLTSKESEQALRERVAVERQTEVTP